MECEIKIFKLNDCDWYAAESLMAALKCAFVEYDYDPEYIEEPHELTDDELDDCMFTFTDDYDRPQERMSFRAALAKQIADGKKFPDLFASTES